MSAIATDGLTKYYGDVRGVEDLDLEVSEGEVFGFLGPNGAGKTTTIRTIMGFLAPTAGEARLLGRDVTEERELRAAKARVGYLPSDPGLDERVTGRRLLEYYGALRGDERSGELLERFDPPLDRTVGEYSRGNRQMLAIVLAAMHGPELLVMDEPTSGLDPLKQERFHEFVREEAEAGRTVFLSSHVLSEVQAVCDRVGIVRDGRLAELASVDELLARGGKRVTARLRGAVDRETFDRPGVHDLRLSRENGATALSFTYTGEYDALLAALADREVLDLTVRDAPLEEVFMRYYGEEPPADGDEDGVTAGV
jgi:ABC-2 type transport system ATP-binding protein